MKNTSQADRNNVHRAMPRGAARTETGWFGLSCGAAFRVWGLQIGGHFYSQVLQFSIIVGKFLKDVVWEGVPEKHVLGGEERLRSGMKDSAGF